jgi:hypothetical protein
MRPVRNTLALLLALFSTAYAGVDSGHTFESVVAGLAEAGVVRGNFTQTRKIELLSRPLESSGNFILSDLGLYWQQTQPFTSVLIADGERLVQRLEDGPATSVDVADNPMVLSFSRIFLSIFEGSEEELRSNFEISFASGGDDWAMSLKPMTYPLSEAIETINLQGREYIDGIAIINRSSDEMTIRFSDVQTLPNQLTEHEIELYAR